MNRVSLMAVVVACCSAASASAQIVADGGFELGTPNAAWDEFSGKFGTPICNEQRCGNFFGDPFEGEWWAWFGGATRPEVSYLRQEVTIPVGTAATLRFYLDITAASGNGSDFLLVSLDGVGLVVVLDSDMNSFHPWTEVVVDVSHFADGESHLLSFDSEVSGPFRSNFYVDAVEIIVESGLLGDLNCDGTVDALDIEPFLVALFDPAGYPIQYPDCDINLGDINGDGDVNALDIEGFLELLFGP